ncbi:MAG TPA: DPP IV N-terminal domain-containing protein [Vicinamibacterales bacterium]|nr:DPP IV N-terminal domain-containing protein [Vicinamibacterales bacterium]
MSKTRSLSLMGAALGLALMIVPMHAQDRLRTMPGYDQFQKMQTAMQGGPAVISGAVTPTWAEDGKSFTYSAAGKAYKFDLATMRAEVTGDAPVAGAGRGAGPGRAGGAPPAGGRQGGGGRGAAQLPSGAPNPCPPEQVQRGRQAACSASPDGKMKAYYRDRNIYVSNADGTGEVAITTDGSEKSRVKYGVGSWVYGEELGQTTAIWWSPDSRKVGFYRFDESKVKDYYIQMEQTQLQVSLDTEAYPKAGTDNPVADVMVYDVATKQKVTLDTRSGKPFANETVGYYVYGMTPQGAWLPDSSEMLMNRTNRRQNVMEYIACSPATTKCRVIVPENWPTGWVENRPTMRWLADHKRFIWESERNGFSNYYLYDISGRLINPITTNATFESAGIVKVDEAAGVMFYMARDGDNYMKQQLHRVGLDGKGDVRLTDPKFTHTVSLSPDNKFFTDVYQTHDTPAATQLVDASGKVVAQLAKSDLAKFNAIGLKKVEMFTYKAAYGATTLYGTIAFPSTFDPSRKYPTLVSVYGGPASGSSVPTETFATPSATAEYGFLLVSLSSRAAPGMGKKMLDSIYMKLGVTEMDDMAEGIKSLWTRPYFDKERVGIYGTSYGGYTSAMEILRHPEVFTAASASSPVTSWYHYDTIYTERYMWIPQENKEGYENGSAMKYARDLQGRLLLYYGTADNNVHPNNSMQLIKALQQAGKSFEVQVGPDAGHSGVNNQRMMEFFIENLIQHPERLKAPVAPAR